MSVGTYACMRVGMYPIMHGARKKIRRKEEEEGRKKGEKDFLVVYLFEKQPKMATVTI